MQRVCPSLGVLVLVLAGALAPAAEPLTRAWRVADLARADGEAAALGDRGRRVLHQVSTGQMRRLYAVEQAIERVAEIEAEFVIVEGRIPNAFAGVGEGGEQVVGINLAMLEMIGSDMHAAAALLGHELAHLKLAHGEKAARSRAGSSTLGAIGGIVLGGIGVPAAGGLSALTVAAMDSDYSRDNEREADYLGAIWALEAGFEVEGAVRLHELLTAQGGGAKSSFLSTHPSGPERIARLKALAARLSRAPAP